MRGPVRGEAAAADRHHDLPEEVLERPAARPVVSGRTAGGLEVAAFPGTGATVVALHFGVGAWIHRRHRESLAVLGLGRRRFAAGLRQAVVRVGPPAVAVLAAGAVAGTWYLPPPFPAERDLAVYAVWGTMQQYGLPCVLDRRPDALLPGRRAPVVAVGLLFGVSHVPDLFLVVVTEVLGFLPAWLYRRVPNALALGLAHGVLGVVPTHTLRVGLALSMHVGPGMPGR